MTKQPAPGHARHPARTLRVPDPAGSGLRRIAAAGSAPRPLAERAPAQGGAEPAPLPTHQARQRKVKAPKAHRTSRKTTRKSGRSAAGERTIGPGQTTAIAPSAAVAAIDLGAALAAWFGDLTYMAGQPGSYQRMGGF